MRRRESRPWRWLPFVKGLAGGLLLAGAYLTWRQLQVNREGQITERYTRGVEQLGSDNRGVRVGGIYALERIAKDPPRIAAPCSSC